MFSNDPHDLTSTLSAMDREARIKANFNQYEARDLVASWIKQDARFSGYDSQRLAHRVQQCKSNGAVLDLDDPYLRRGGEPRPLDKAQW
jgi:hypothetical protein